MNAFIRRSIDIRNELLCISFLNEHYYDIKIMLFEQIEGDEQGYPDGKRCTKINPSDINIRLNPNIVGIDIVAANRTKKYGKRDKGYENLFTAFKTDMSLIDDCNFSDSGDIISNSVIRMMTESMTLYKELHPINIVYHIFMKTDNMSRTGRHYSEERDDVRNYKNYNRGFPSKFQRLRSPRNAI